MCVDEIIPDHPKLELEATQLPWGKPWEMKTSGKSLLTPVKSPAVPVPGLAAFLAQTPSLSCLPQKMRELTRKPRRSLLRPAMACPLSKTTSQPLHNGKARQKAGLSASPRAPCAVPSAPLTGRENSTARPAAAQTLLLLGQGRPATRMSTAATFHQAHTAQAGGHTVPRTRVGCQGTPQGSWEGKGKHNAFCGESTVLKNLEGKVCVF